MHFKSKGTHTKGHYWHVRSGNEQVFPIGGERGKLCKIAFQTRHTIYSGLFGLNKICTLTHLPELYMYMCPCGGFRNIDKSRVR